MSGKTTQTTSSSTQPWKPTIPTLKDIIAEIQGNVGNTGITATETGALDQLQANANQPDPNLGNISSLATDLFSGGPDRTGYATNSYDALKSSLNPIAAGNNLRVDSNPYIRSIVDTTNSNVKNAVNSAFGAAGRTYSGAHAGVLAKALGENETSLYASEYGKERDRMDAAIRDLYTAGNTTGSMLSDLDTKTLQNRTAGIDVSNAANALRDQPATRTLEIEAMRRGIPIQNLGDLSNLIVPIAGLGQQSNSTTTTKGNPIQTAIGGAIGGAGLLGKLGAFGPAGWLSQPMSGFATGLLSR